MDDIEGIKLALKQAELAFKKNEVPIGSILIHDGKIISQNHNQREIQNNFLAHAEILVLEKAQKKLENWRLPDTTLYVTTEPCPMCLGALLQTRVSRLVFGCPDPKRSSKNHFPTLKDKKYIEGNNHRLEITGGILEKECSEILKKFFQKRR